MYIHALKHTIIDVNMMIKLGLEDCREIDVFIAHLLGKLIKTLKKKSAKFSHLSQDDISKFIIYSNKDSSRYGIIIRFLTEFRLNMLYREYNRPLMEVIGSPIFTTIVDLIMIRNKNRKNFSSSCSQYYQDSDVQ